MASPLLLGHQRHDADGQVVGLRHVGGDEADAAVPEREQERRVPRQPVELGDEQRRPGDLGEMQRLAEFRPVRQLAALHLGEPGDDLRRS